MRDESCRGRGERGDERNEFLYLRSTIRSGSKDDLETLWTAINQTFSLTSLDQTGLRVG